MNRQYAFPSVPHLLGSASEAQDVVLSAAQSLAFLSGRVRVLEKLDGLNVGVLFTPGGAPRVVSRVHGVLRLERLGPGLWPLVDWVWAHRDALHRLLGRRTVLYGEWLAGPRKLAYPRLRFDFVGFALFDRALGRFVKPAIARARLGNAGFATPPVRFEGRVGSVDELRHRWARSSFGGPAEGVIVERADGRFSKVVRPEWLALPLVHPAPWRPGRLVRPVLGRVWRKTFPAGREADCALEASVLRALAGLELAPPLRRGDALALDLQRIDGSAWPARPGVALAFTLGQQLGRLHRVRRVKAPPLPGPPSAHVARVAPGPLVKFLRAQERSLRPVAPVLCHGDLKPENLVVARGGVWLIDLERAVLSDPAWELACAMDRLALDAPCRQALLEGWTSTFGADEQVAQRTQLFRVAWRVVLPHAVAALERETGRRPSARARALASG